MALKGILSKGQLSEIEFVFPPLALQNEFAAFAQQADKSEFITQILAIFLKKYHNKTIEALGESADARKGARI